MTNPLQNAALFLVKCGFNFFITLVMLRFIFQLVRADFFNPMSQFVVKLTNPLLIPCRRIIPALFGLDFASLFLLVVLQMGELLAAAFVLGASIKFTVFFGSGLLIFGFGEILGLLVWLYTMGIAILVIYSWVGQGRYHPIIALLIQVTEPLLLPVRRLMPSFGGLDLSPMIAIVLLQTVNLAVVEWLVNTGRFMTRILF